MRLKHDMYWLMPALLFLLLLPVDLVHAKTPSGKEIIKDVQGAYKKLDSFSCNFRLEFTWAMVNEKDVEEGSIEMAKGDRFRYEASNQVMVTDGKTLWRFSPANKQCIIENVKQVDDAVLPRELLFNYPKKFDPGEVTEVNLDGRLTYTFPLVPKEGGLGVEKVTVWIDATDFITRRMQYQDDSGNSTLYILQDIRTDPGIPDDHFIFNVPDDVKAFDLR